MAGCTVRLAYYIRFINIIACTCMCVLSSIKERKAMYRAVFFKTWTTTEPYFRNYYPIAVSLIMSTQFCTCYVWDWAVKFLNCGKLVLCEPEEFLYDFVSCYSTCMYSVHVHLYSGIVASSLVGNVDITSCMCQYRVQWIWGYRKAFEYFAICTVV